MPQGFYEDASVYDILHAPGTAADVTGLERMADRFAIKRGAWLEPACGSARYLRVAAGRGRRVIGYDIEPGMIAYARERFKRAGLARRATLRVGSMEDTGLIEPASCAFAFNLINTIRHLMSDRAMLRHLEQVARALRPGGAYAVGIGMSFPDWDEPVEDVWTAARGRTRVTQTVQYLPPAGTSRVERVVSHVQVRVPTRERHIDSTYDLRTYSLEQWYDLIAASPFRIAGVVGETGHDADPSPGGYAIYMLKHA
ncbi:MAG: class I SAM-dependent methyltransferase [Phycisphaerales bacterium]